MAVEKLANALFVPSIFLFKKYRKIIGAAINKENI